MTEQRVLPNDDVTVYATDKARFYRAGEAFQVHKVQAEKLIADGKATAKPVVKEEANKPVVKEEAKK